MREAQAVALLLLFGVAACGSSWDEPVSDRHPLRVFAAASLIDLLEDAAAARTDLPPFEVHLAGSEVLLRQVAAGAPADLLLLARPVEPDELPPGAEVSDFARAVLVVAGAGRARDGSAAEGAGDDAAAGAAGAEGVAGVAGATPRGPADLRGRRVAVADPGLAPAGAYAREALAAAGVLDALGPSLVVAAHVRDACRWVVFGEADLVVCYRADVVAVDGLVELFAFADVDVRYGAALTAPPARREAAARLLAGLAGDAARLRAHGLEPIGT